MGVFNHSNNDEVQITLIREESNIEGDSFLPEKGRNRIQNSMKWNAKKVKLFRNFDEAYVSLSKLMKQVL